MYVCMSECMYAVTAHGGRGRVGSVGRGGDQTHIAVSLAPRQVVAADAQQTRILPLHTYIHMVQVRL